MEVIPNWHPIMVHFAITMVTLSAAVHLYKSHRPEKQARAAWAQSIVTPLTLLVLTLTIATGFYAFYTVRHDSPSHAAMLDHRAWAIGAFLIFLVGVMIWRWGSGQANAFRSVIFLVSFALVGTTAFKGGELVYRYGLGVMALPETSSDGHDHEHPETSQPGEAAPVETDALLETASAQAVVAFGRALRSGDTARLGELLDAKVLIVEGSGVERSLAEYAAHHMQADIAFTKASKSEVMERHGKEEGDIAYVITRSSLQSEGAEKSLIMNETMVLRKTDGQWKIVHIHWSNS